jgi:hypothetical protein
VRSPARERPRRTFPLVEGGPPSNIALHDEDDEGHFRPPLTPEGNPLVVLRADA